MQYFFLGGGICLIPFRTNVHLQNCTKPLLGTNFLTIGAFLAVWEAFLENFNIYRGGGPFKNVLTFFANHQQKVHLKTSVLVQVS